MNVNVHQDAVPTEVRETDVVGARIKLDLLDAEFVPVRVWRISPFGIEIVEPDSALSLRKGQNVQLQIVIGGRRTQFDAVVIGKNTDGKTDVIGIRFFLELAPSEDSRNKRRFTRWICSEEFLPKAIAPSPGRYNEFIGFTILNFSTEGIQLTTTIKNAYLIPGMQLSLSINLPMVGDSTLLVEIVRLKIDTHGADEVLDLGAKIVKMSADTRKKIGQYLLHFSDNATLESLMIADFLPDEAALAMSFTATKTEHDYREILSLRKGQRRTPAADFTHTRDNSSRLILGRLGKTPVFTSRVAYPTSSDLLEAEGLSRWAEASLRRDEVIEVSEIHTDCAHQITPDVMIAALRYICSSCTNSNRHNVVIVAPPTFPIQLNRLGWTKLGDDNENSIYLGNAYAAIKGKNTSPILWNFVWRDVAEYLIEADVINPAGIEKVMLNLYRLFSPVARLVFKNRERKMRRLGVTQNKEK